MTHSRREFLKTLGIAGGPMAVIGLVSRLEAAPCAADPLSPPLAADELEALAGVVFTRARTLGCSEASVLITCSRTGVISPWSKPGLVESRSVAFTVRVVHSRAWGVAQSPSVSAASLSARKVEIARLAALAAADAQANERLAERPWPLTLTSASSDPWVMPGRMQAFDMPAKAQRAFRQAVDDAARKLDGAMNAGSCVTVHGEETYFVSTAGAYQHTLGTSVA